MKRFTIGRASERDGDGGLSLAEARREALALKERLARGEDPRAIEAHEKAEAIRRRGHTFANVVEEFLRVHHPVNKKALRPSSLRRYKLVLEGPDFAPWRERPLASITRADVLEALHRMQDRGLGISCNRALAAIRVLSRWAVNRGYLETTPTDSIKPIAPELSRDRHLYGDVEHDQPSEIALLWKACETAQVGPFGALPKLLLLTGARRDEVASMKYSELIDLDGAAPRWSLPAERTKNYRRHLIPLTPEAVRIIQTMPRIVGSEFVFSTTGTTAFSGFSNFKEKVDRKIDALKKDSPTKYARQFVTEWRLHDLRRTVKTGLAELGIRSDVRDALLNHAKPGMDRVYDQSSLGTEKRAALEKWEAYIVDLVKADAKPSVKRKR